MSAFAPMADAKKKRKPFSFAPYVDVSGWPPPDLPAIKAASGIRAVSLGFITARGGNECVPTWGGYAEYPAFGGDPYRLADIDAFRRAGGRIVVSFGGAAGAELATVCESIPQLVAAYRQVIAAYRPTHIDFDVEGSTLGDVAANARRTAAIKQLQKAKKQKKKKKKRRRPSPIAVSFTLPVLPNGLQEDGLDLVRQAASRGVRISIVNGMAMDYGPFAAPNPDGQMGEYAIQVGNSLFGQLRGVYPKLRAARVWRKVGITPMIGINDVPTEKFYVSDAHQLAAFARARHIGLLAMWQLNRDRQCPVPTATTREDCSGVDQAPYDFSRALGSRAG